MKFEERVGRRAVIRPVQRLEYLFILHVRIRITSDEEEEKKTHRDDIGVTHDGVGQREGKDDLEFERRHVAVHGDILQRI